MQWGIVLGLVVVLGFVASFLMYFISGALKTKDSSKIDEVPSNHFSTK
ncbi:hypothetical protein [Bacillus niameyensis]|nr:hypothetical protein [Bacillus niameyensis]